MPQQEQRGLEQDASTIERIRAIGEASQGKRDKLLHGVDGLLRDARPARS